MLSDYRVKCSDEIVEQIELAGFWNRGCVALEENMVPQNKGSLFLAHTKTGSC